MNIQIGNATDENKSSSSIIRFSAYFFFFFSNINIKMSDILSKWFATKVDNQNQTDPPTQQIHLAKLVEIISFVKQLHRFFFCAIQIDCEQLILLHSWNVFEDVHEESLLIHKRRFRYLFCFFLSVECLFNRCIV